MITEDITNCVEILKAEELLGFPTETVYGLGARADSPLAVKKIFKAKSRPNNHPLIVHGSSASRVFECAKDIPEYAYVLAEAFWPGPMSLILTKDSTKGMVCEETTGGQDSVAVRVPGHNVALDLFSRCDFLVAGPSANQFSHVSPTSASHVVSEFGEELPVLDGGNCHVGVESTIISCLKSVPKILRTGSVTAAQVAQLLEIPEDDLSVGDLSKIKVSGNMKIHYSPKIPVYVFHEVDDMLKYIKKNKKNKLAYMGFHDFVDEKISYKHLVNSGEEFAHKLYSFFRKAEDQNCSEIIVQAPDSIGIGAAINDRLFKASSKWRA